MAEDQWAAFRVKQVAQAETDPWAAFRAKPAAVENGAAPLEMPSYDAMGNPTGGVEAVKPSRLTGTNPVDALSRGIGQGATLGGLDELAAASAGVAAKAVGQDFTPAFQQSLQASQANNKAAREAHPYIYGAGQVAGAVPGLVYGGATALGAKALGLVGRNFFTRSAAAATSGLGMGAVEGALGTDGDMEARKSGAGYGAAGGAVLGGASPALGAAVGAGVNKVGQLFASRGTTPANMTRSAADALAEDIGRSGGGSAVQQRLADMGPEAMLLDASPSLQGRAQGLAVRPETRQTIVDPLSAREAGTNQRLAAGIDESFGPAVVPSQIEAGLAAARDALTPDYRRVLQGAGPVNTGAIAGRLEHSIAQTRGPEQQSLQRVRGMLDEMGEQGGLHRDPGILFNTRQAVDGMIADNTNPQVVRQLSIARGMIDEELTHAVPGIKQVDARYEELARQSAGLSRGSQVLDTGKTAIRPQEMQQDLARGAVPREAVLGPEGNVRTPGADIVGPSAESFRVRQGVRGEIDRAVGTKANDLLALKQRFQGEGDWNREKLAQLFTPERADQAFRTVDRETGFRDTYRRIHENSMTEPRRQSAEAVKPRGEGSVDALPILAGAAGGPQAMAAALGWKGVNAVANQAMRAADLERNAAMARALVSRSGPEQTAMIDLLGRRAEGRELSSAAGDRTQRLVQLLLESQGNRVGEAGRSQLFR